MAARVCVTTGDTALTDAATSAAICVWTCALACVQETAATPSVRSASDCWTTVSHFLPPSKLKHQRHNVSLLATMQPLCRLPVHLHQQTKI